MSVGDDVSMGASVSTGEGEKVEVAVSKGEDVSLGAIESGNDGVTFGVDTLDRSIVDEGLILVSGVVSISDGLSLGVDGIVEPSPLLDTKVVARLLDSGPATVGDDTSTSWFVETFIADVDVPVVT